MVFVIKLIEKKMRKILKILIASDAIYYTGFGLVAPIFAIFLKENLIGGSVVAVGIAATIYILVKSIVQLPIAKYVDKHRHKANLLILGSFIMVSVPFLYILSTHVKHIYCIQLLYGLASGITYPSWVSLFSTHLSRRREGFEWSVYSTCIGISTAVAAYLGAYIAHSFGFNVLFYVIGALAFSRAIVVCFLEKREIKMIRKKELERLTHFFIGRKREMLEKQSR